jgi:hypothetical protein
MKYSVGDSLGNSASEVDTSLYGDLSLNPSVISLVKSPKKTSTSSHGFVFQNSLYSVWDSIDIYWHNNYVGIYQRF